MITEKEKRTQRKVSFHKRWCSLRNGRQKLPTYNNVSGQLFITKQCVCVWWDSRLCNSFEKVEHYFSHCGPDIG